MDVKAPAGMLAWLHTLVRDWVRHGAAPDLGVLRAMVFCIHAYPERLHHPKETGLLFAAMRACGVALGDRLDAEHAIRRRRRSGRCSPGSSAPRRHRSGQAHPCGGAAPRRRAAA